MPEGVATYPRWYGTLSGPPAWAVIAGQEIRKTWLGFWGRVVILLALGWSLVQVANLYTLTQGRSPSTIHTVDNFLSFLHLISWASLGVAAVMSGPALLEDARRGALELYLARSITTREYLAGKVVAVFGLSAAVFIACAAIYWLGAMMVVGTQPANWSTIILPAAAYGLVWALVVSGVGLGVSSVARSSVAAALLLFGGFAIGDLLVSDLFASVTNSDAAKLLSPFAAMEQQRTWLFSAKAPFNFPDWWGAVELLVLIGVGWALVAWKHPRIKGEE